MNLNQARKRIDALTRRQAAPPALRVVERRASDGKPVTQVWWGNLLVKIFRGVEWTDL